jgi:integrase
MKKLYRLFRRGDRYYAEHVETRKQTSLRTGNEAEALRLVAAKNEAAQAPMLNLALARTYMTAHDLRMIDRTWNEVMEEICQHGGASTRARYRRAVADKAFDSLRNRRLVETTSDELLAILHSCKPSTNHFLLRLHNLAQGLGWLPWVILAPRFWPDAKLKKKRAVTFEEFQRIVEAEGNVERRRYYELLWEIGAAQTDAAMLSAANVEWSTKVLSYQRCKTGEWARLVIGESLERLLRELPSEGPFFPHLRTTNASARSAEFCRRCRTVGVKGISLHCFRYSWAQRAKKAGYPQRWAESALGHSSRAVHSAYAQGAVVFCPPLEEYERNIVPLLAAAAVPADGLKERSKQSVA